MFENESQSIRIDCREFSAAEDCRGVVARSDWRRVWLSCALLFGAVFAGCVRSEEEHQSAELVANEQQTIRIAVFNIWELSREKLDQIDDRGRGTNRQLVSAAEIIQRVRPEILLINEIDFDSEGKNARLFISRYLQFPQEQLQLIDYPHVYFEAVNTGVPSGFDLDQDGSVDGPADAWGFGRYPGQYGMALLSQVPIDRERVRTFRNFKWANMPGHLMPDGQDSPVWYTAEQAAALRLSSKSHWDVPIVVGPSKKVLHILAAHPTPPAFDGSEHRNRRRNFDEIRLLADYLDDQQYLVDDLGRAGGLDDDATFVILGDLNADPVRDLADYGRTAISQLLDHPRVEDPRQSSLGAVEDSTPYDGAASTRTTPRWGRLDYALPSADLEIIDSGVFWPPAADPLSRLVDGDARASDHRLVWVTVRLGPADQRGD